eukprot:779519-Pyramimonas_sp.AAC.1
MFPTQEECDRPLSLRESVRMGCESRAWRNGGNIPHRRMYPWSRLASVERLRCFFLLSSWILPEDHDNDFQYTSRFALHTCFGVFVAMPRYISRARLLGLRECVQIIF